VQNYKNIQLIPIFVAINEYWMEKKYYAIIVAGGSGSRMGGEIAKQFINLGGKPVIVHTIERFLSVSKPLDIILVLPSDYKEYWKTYCFENNFNFRHTLVSGGITRFHSVKSALRYVKRGGIVAVHDGVRPFISPQYIEELYEIADSEGAVVPVISPSDSLRVKNPDGSTSVTNRDNYFLVQTPQVFRSDTLLDAYNQAFSTSFTDDASVVEGAGAKIHLAKGKVTNIKLTQPEDLILAEAILSVF
jgi:2-C-methyl-D-erythritol 4-phosphate cytidylyltransferase